MAILGKEMKNMTPILTRLTLLTLPTLCAVALTGAVGCSHSTSSSTMPAAAPSTRPAVAAVAAPAPGYKMAGEFAIGQPGRWDYLLCDRDAHRLYVPRTDRVLVLDSRDGRVMGVVPGTPGVHGVALAKHLGRGFTSNGADGTVTIFDTRSLDILGKLPAGKNPDAILYDSTSKRVFVFNGKSQDATVFDSAVSTTNPTALATIALGGKVEFAVSDHVGQVFVNIEDTNEIVRIDAQTLTVTARWSIAPGEEPTGLAMDLKSRRLFAVCGNNLMVVVNADTGKVITTLPIGKGADAAAFDPEYSLAFASCGDGTLTVVRESSADQFSVVQTVSTRPGARTMALDTRTHRIYLPTAQFNPPAAPTGESPRPRPQPIDGTFVIVVVEPAVAAAPREGQ